MSATEWVLSALLVAGILFFGAERFTREYYEDMLADDERHLEQTRLIRMASFFYRPIERVILFISHVALVIVFHSSRLRRKFMRTS